MALLLPGSPDDEYAEVLVRRALAGQDDWGTLEIERFPGRDSTLLLVHPAEGVYIRREALRFLLYGYE